MSESIREWTKEVRLRFPFNAGKVLDVGSLNVNGSVKDIFPDASKYIGIDFREGKDVDVVMNSHELVSSGRFQGGEFDTIICMNMLEHDSAFWVTLKNIDYLLKQGGYLLVVVPTFGFPIHEHPQDYWRFGEDAFREYVFDQKLFELLELKIVNTKPNINPVICGLGMKL